MDPCRVLTHPGYPQIVGQGIYEYPFNPNLTKNFLYYPARKVDVSIQRTLTSTVTVRQQQVDEDVVISEVWFGGSGQLSTLAEMARVFHEFWVTPCPVGELCGWEPLDVTTERYEVEIVGVEIGGPDYEYREVREILDSHEGAMIEAQLTLRLKLGKSEPLPLGSVTLEGV